MKVGGLQRFLKKKNVFSLLGFELRMAQAIA
jgi:hypothetical protein